MGASAAAAPPASDTVSAIFITSANRVPGGAAWRMPLPPRNTSSSAKKSDVRERPLQRRADDPPGEDPEGCEPAARQDAEVIQRPKEDVVPGQRDRGAEDRVRCRRCRRRRRTQALLPRDARPRRRCSSARCTPRRERRQRDRELPPVDGCLPGEHGALRCVVDGGVSLCDADAVVESTVTALGAFASTAPFVGVVWSSVACANAVPGKTSAATMRDEGDDEPHAAEANAGPVLALPLPCRSTSTAVRTVTSSR